MQQPISISVPSRLWRTVEGVWRRMYDGFQSNLSNMIGKGRYYCAVCTPGGGGRGGEGSGR